MEKLKCEKNSKIDTFFSNENSMFVQEVVLNDFIEHVLLNSSENDFKTNLSNKNTFLNFNLRK